MTASPTRAPAGVLPYLIVGDGAKAIDFYVAAFGAEEAFRLTDTDGRIGHAELDLAGGRIMLADEYPDFGALGPASVGGTPVKLHLRVEDADTVVARAEQAGATVLRPPSDQFFGERSGLVVDPFGHHWFVSHQIEDVSPEEMQRRFTG